MKVIILAGGYGTRISEETDTKPKPMVLIDDKPIIWHVMSIYAAHGIKDFIIATGYKGEIIHDWVKQQFGEWNVQAVDTGLDTQTGGRIKLAAEKFDDETFLVTYGDGVGNVNIAELILFHQNHGKLATVTAVRPPARFGVLHSENGLVIDFGEKNQADSGWINGGFFVLNRKSLDSIFDNNEPFEAYALPRLVESKELMAYHHNGFWKPMDTLREKNELSQMAGDVIPPWLAGFKI
ncbi:GCD1 Nucleoside-diphosphate-sugar pyrophosphorylase involved in lipopolysaccharide biosynthesis/translation initiation factor 2B, gamma/epsilon subunits (eIF-2Bgamma/eIF-2Bepsilon) [Candidatus Nanopelagicaceae bacterium]